MTYYTENHAIKALSKLTDSGHNFEEAGGLSLDHTDLKYIQDVVRMILPETAQEETQSEVVQHVIDLMGKRSRGW